MEEADKGWLMIRIGLRVWVGECFLWYWLTWVVPYNRCVYVCVRSVMHRSQLLASWFGTCVTDIRMRNHIVVLSVATHQSS